MNYLFLCVRECAHLGQACEKKKKKKKIRVRMIRKRARRRWGGDKGV